MVDDDGIAIAADPAGFDDSPAVGGLDRGPIIDADVDTAMVDGRPEDGMSPIAVRRSDDAVDGPDHGTGPSPAGRLGAAGITAFALVAAVGSGRSRLGFSRRPLAQHLGNGLGSLLIFGISLFCRRLIGLSLVEDSLLFFFMRCDFVALGLRFIAQFGLAVALYF